MSEMELKRKIDSELLPFVNKPTRYLGNEYNSVLKDLRTTDFRAALCFPDLYDLGIQNITYEILYHLLNAQPNIWAERVYAPGFDAEQAMLSAEIPLFSLESKTALSEFDLVVFFVQDRLTYPNILNMLHLGGIALKNRDRTSNSPMVIGLGPALNNPEPMADFFDAVIIGEPESTFLTMVDVLRRSKKEQWDKPQMYQQLSQLPGSYIPSFYQPNYNNFKEFQGITKLEASAPQSIYNAQNNTSGKQYTISPLVPLSDHSINRTVFGEIGSMPSKNGDAAGFQPAANRLTEPANSKSLDSLFLELQKLLRRTEGNDIDLPLINNAGINEVFWMHAKEKASLSSTGIQVKVPGFRLGIQQSVSPEIAESVRNSGFILSCGAGSQRLRNVLNMNLKEHELLQALQTVLKRGWKFIRLSFVIGLPLEKDADIIAIADFCKKCLEAAEPFPDTQFLVVIQLFSPAAHTPFQWEKQDQPAMLGKKLALLQERLSQLPVKLQFQEPFSASLKTALSRGDRHLGMVIENAWRMGVRFDMLKENYRPDRWQKAFQEAEVSLENYLSPISITVPLPWDHIDVGVSKSFLKEEKLRASQGQLHPQNKDIISLGYGGIPRDNFEKLVQQSRIGHFQNAGSVNVGQASGQQTAAESAEKVRYGRRGRKLQTPVAAIKRKIRIRYSKTGLTRFLSHLDIVRVFERSATLAKVPLVYSQGLRRNPKISYGPPLPVGIASTAEYLDMEVEIGREVDLQNRLNQYLPDGLQILQFQEIYTKAKALAAFINRALYEAHLPETSLPQTQGWMDGWLAQPEAQIERITKDGTRQVDIRPYLRDLKWTDHKLLITIDSIEGRTAKVVEVLESLLSPHGIDYRQFPVHRTGQFIVKDDEILTPFEVI